MSASKSRTVEILSGATNAAVVQLSGRRFPGIVVQGDTLHSWSVLADSLMLRVSATANIDPEVALEMVELADLIRGHLDAYEDVLRARGLELPYPTDRE
jgi:hypothetical protein